MVAKAVPTSAVLLATAGVAACGAPAVEDISEDHAIAFVRVVPEGRLERDLLWVVDREGRNEAQISTIAALDSGPAWGPAGGRLAVVSTWDGKDTGESANASPQIWVLPLGGKGFPPVRDPLVRADPGFLVDMTPAWSPDGRRLAYPRWNGLGYALFLVDVSTGALSQLTSGPVEDSPQGNAYAPAWSPDGDLIAFFLVAGDVGQLHVVRADGTGLTRLTDFALPTEWSCLWCHTGGAGWSLDGSLIAFHASDLDGNLDVYVIRPDGTGLRRLTDSPAADGDPAWSPDGSEIAFASDRTGHGDIYVMDADGSNVRRLTSDPGRESHPDWRPTVQTRA